MGTYDTVNSKKNIYCGDSDYLKLSVEGEINQVEYYTGIKSNKSCSTIGNFKFDENKNMTIYGLSNPNTYGAAEQFNGIYKWTKGTLPNHVFYDSYFTKENSNIILLINEKDEEFFKNKI